MQRKRKLNILINNAAMMLSSRDLTPRHTADGLEITMATNHLGRFSLLFSFLGFLSTHWVSDTSCQNARSIYTVPCCMATSSYRRHIFFCTASVEQAANRAEAAEIDRFTSSSTENISVWCCLWSPAYGLTLWCALGLSVEGAIKMPQLLLLLLAKRLAGKSVSKMT